MIFNIEALISVGCNVVLSEIDCVYDLLGHMTGTKVYTHEIPALLLWAQPLLLNDFPFLKEIVIPEDLNKENGYFFLWQQGKKYGFEFEVKSYKERYHEMESI
jgi:hypothetical protein